MDTFTHADLVFDVTDAIPASGGDTAETVVLLHGFPEDRHSWAALTPALTAAGYRVLAPDLRGYSPGARPTARSAYALEQLAGDVLALADGAGARRFHVVGHDWGAMLAWQVAADHPDRVSSLTALSVPHPMAFTRAMYTGTQALRSWYMLVCQLPWLPEFVLSLRGGRMIEKGLVRVGLDAESAGRYAVRAAERGAMRGPVNWYRGLPFDMRRPAPRVEVPTLYVWGTADSYVSRTAAQLCHDYVTGSYRFLVLDGASHWLPECEAGRISGALTEHLANAGAQETGTAGARPAP